MDLSCIYHLKSAIFTWKMHYPSRLDVMNGPDQISGLFQEVLNGIFFEQNITYLSRKDGNNN